MQATSYSVFILSNEKKLARENKCFVKTSTWTRGVLFSLPGIRTKKKCCPEKLNALKKVNICGCGIVCIQLYIVDTSCNSVELCVLIHTCENKKM